MLSIEKSKIDFLSKLSDMISRITLKIENCLAVL